jgi:hypothetical protein
MNKRQVVENLPQAFIPNSRAAKKAGKLNAEEALRLAKSQGRKVVFIARGQSAEFKKASMEVPEIIPNEKYPSREAAKFLKINTNALQHLRNLGKIKAEKINGKIFYLGSEIERFKAVRD